MTGGWSPQWALDPGVAPLGGGHAFVSSLAAWAWPVLSSPGASGPTPPEHPHLLLQFFAPWNGEPQTLPPVLMTLAHLCAPWPQVYGVCWHLPVWKSLHNFSPFLRVLAQLPLASCW